MVIVENENMRFPKANGEKEALSERLGQGWVL